jgi:RND family efflux transporter MFP subunit
MARVLIPILATVASLALSLAAAAQDGAPAGAPKGPPPTPVKVAEARTAELAPRKRVYGELRAPHRSMVAAEEAGIVREALVSEGLVVAKGDVLARLDDTRVRLEMAVNAANLLAANAVVEERRAVVLREERDLELLRRASAEGGTNPRELTDAESALAIARAQVESARAAAAVVEQQGALLARRVRDLEIRAPFGGVITSKSVEPGAWIAAGGAVVELLDTAHLEAWFDVPQEFFPSATALASARAPSSTSSSTPSSTSSSTPSSAPSSAASEAGAIQSLEIRTTLDTPVRAGAIRVIPEIDPRSRTFHAVAEIANGDGRLAAGMALEAFVPQGAPTSWTMVPKDALVYQGVSASIFVVRGGLAAPTPVRVAFPVGDEVALEPGSVAAGDQVVIEGNERLMPMTPVAPIPAAASAGAAR